MPQRKIGVIIADVDEFTPFAATVKGARRVETPFKDALTFSAFGAQVTALLCGMGKVNAAAGTMYLIDSGYDMIISMGFSGGLSGVRRGDFVLPERFMEHDFDLTPIGYKPCEKPGQNYIYAADAKLIGAIAAAGVAKASGTAVCGDRFISDDKSRDFLVNNFSASTCDMETAAVASVCDITKTPFVALRRISDDAGDSAAESYEDMNDKRDRSLSEVFLECLKIICEA